MDERGSPSDGTNRPPRERQALSLAVFAVFFLAMALWNTSLLDAGSRLRKRLVHLESSLDSLERVQSNQLARERLLAGQIARLQSLEEDIQSKADAATVWVLRTRVDTLATRADQWRTSAREPRAAGSP